MSNSDDLNHVFGPLRSSATQAELADEMASVEAMAQAHTNSKGRISMLTNSKARVATLIAAGIIGFGGVAAAGPGGLSQTLEVPPEETVVTTTATTVPEEQEEKDGSETTETTEVAETSVVTTTEAPPEEPEDPEESKETSGANVVTAPAVDDPDTDFFDETTCRDGNHGQTVSAVASGLEEYAEEFADVEVRDAARSTCGKKADSEEEEGPESKQADSDDNDHNDDDDDDDEGKPEKDEKPGKGNSSEKSNKGRGNGPKSD
jgi:hypothetical protein